MHRDPFEPILAILESDSPLNAYRQITEEILRRAPNPRRYPVPAAEACRAFLMLRLGLHLGVRQKNLRQLLICQRGSTPSSERRLEMLKCGELRWNEREDVWEVFIPASAFKNSGSSYFSRQPFCLSLRDLGGLYDQINLYLNKHRPRLLGTMPDPGTFFVKTVKANSKSAAYDQNTFYEAWRLAIQRYGIFNPYTGRGAIKGLARVRSATEQLVKQPRSIPTVLPRAYADLAIAHFAPVPPRIRDNLFQFSRWDSGLDYSGLSDTMARATPIMFGFDQLFEADAKQALRMLRKFEKRAAVGLPTQRP